MYDDVTDRLFRILAGQQRKWTRQEALPDVCKKSRYGHVYYTKVCDIVCMMMWQSMYDDVTDESHQAALPDVCKKSRYGDVFYYLQGHL